MTAEGEGAAVQDTRYGFGIACLFTATFFTSTAGIILRLMEEAGGWQVLFYRSVSFAVVLLGYLAWRHGRATPQAFRAVGWPGVVVAIMLGTAFASFILALLETSVANVVFINGSVPFFAALLAWLALGETVRPRIWLAMALAFGGIAIMVAGGLARGTLAGNLLSLLCCLSFAVTLVAMRRGKAVDMLPAVCLAGVLVALVSALLAGSLAISGHDLALAILLGVVQLALQYILVTTASRHVPAAEIALIGRLVIVLAPLWVWLGVGEVPTTTTLIGGAVVVVAIGLHAFWALGGRAEPKVPLQG